MLQNNTSFYFICSKKYFRKYRSHKNAPIFKCPNLLVIENRLKNSKIWEWCSPLISNNCKDFFSRLQLLSVKQRSFRFLIPSTKCQRGNRQLWKFMFDFIFSQVTLVFLQFSCQSFSFRVNILINYIYMHLINTFIILHAPLNFITP